MTPWMERIRICINLFRSAPDQVGCFSRNHKNTYMKSIHSSPRQFSINRVSTKQITTCLAITLALALPQTRANAAVQVVDLAGAADFAVLAGAGITIAAPIDSTRITGDIGTFATTTITGLENLVLNGVNHAGDAVTQQGKTDLGSAYNDAMSRDADVFFVDATNELGGLTLTSGVYNSPTSLINNGVLTLDGGGDSNAVFIFQMGSTLTTGSGSSVELINGAQAGNIFWQVGSSATLGTGSSFEGSILAQTSITATTNATINGRLLAMNGAVSLDNNTITIPEPGNTMLLACSLALVALNRRRKG